MSFAIATLVEGYCVNPTSTCNLQVSWGLLQKIVRFETYLPVGTFLEVGTFCRKKFAYLNASTPNFVPTGKYEGRFW